ncbi:MAG TPA: hypothetical protein VEG60_14295 [Candidatus Binatia bacterium]|nr:hypothetical protein [Candidatus Binatia bacterium]
MDWKVLESRRNSAAAGTHLSRKDAKHAKKFNFLAASSTSLLMTCFGVWAQAVIVSDCLDTKERPKVSNILG